MVRNGVRRVRWELLARVGLVVAAVLILNALLAPFLTTVEAWLSARTMTTLGVRGLQALDGRNLVLIDYAAGPFAARVSPSCSSLTSVVSLVALSMLVLGGPWFRRLWAGLLASVIVVIGNLARIGLVLWMGTNRGVSALVLFHDWVGTMFSVCYTMIGFITLLALRLPSNSRWEQSPPPTYGL